MKTHPQGLAAALATLAAFACLAAPAAWAEANYVYHERTGSDPGCGGAYASPLNPDYTQPVTVRFKVEYQFYTDQARVYYTTDGSSPAGSKGVPTGTTQVVTAGYECTFGSPVVDVAQATIPAQAPGTTVRYIASAWHSGGGDEIFANGPGSPCNCGTPANSAAKATVFAYTVPLPPPQGAIAAWNMEDGTPGAPVPSTGSGTATRGSGLTAGSPEFPVGNSPSPGKSWAVKGFSTGESTAQSGNDYVEFAVSTAGHSGIWFAFDASATSALTARVRYSPDGTTFYSAPSTHAVTTAWGGGIFYVDLSSVGELNDNPNVKIRVYVWGSTTASLYLDNVGLIGSVSEFPAAMRSSNSVIAVPIVSSPASTPNCRQVTVNCTRTSPYYGYVYVVDVTSPACVRIFRPNPASAGTGATDYVDTGWIAKTSAPGTTSPTGIAVDGNDVVWMVHGPSGHSNVQSANHPSASTPEVTGQFVFALPGDLLICRSMWFSGSTSDGSARVYLDNASTGDLSSYRVAFRMKSAGIWDTAPFLSSAPRALPSFGVAADEAGITYCAKPISSGSRECFYRYSAAGAVMADFATAPTWVPTTSAASCTRFGNWVYYSALLGTKEIVLCFDLKGRLIWGFGPPLAGAPADGTYQIVNLAGTDANTNAMYLAVDDRGNVYIRNMVGATACISKVMRPAMRKAVGAAVTSSPVALGGVTYFGADDGRVYAVDSDTGTAVAGFPVDLREAAGSMPASAGRKVLGRVTYREVGGVAYLFATTSDGCVVRLRADNGAIGWAVPRIAAASVDTTPAVATTDSGALGQAAVYVALTDGTSVARVDKLSAADGSVLAQSPNLGVSSGLSISSPSVNGVGVFVSLSGAAAAAYRLNIADLSPRQQVGAGAAAFGSPFMTPSYSTYPRVVIGTSSGTMSAYNATNGTVEYQGVDITPSGSPALSTPYVFGETAYFSGSDGVIYRANVADGSAPAAGYAFYSGAAGTSVAGLAIDPAGISGQPALCFGDSAGRYHKVLLSDATKTVVIPAGASAFTTPTIDAAASAVLLGNGDGSLYRLERR